MNLLKKDKEGKEERFFESEYDSYYSSDDDNKNIMQKKYFVQWFGEKNQLVSPENTEPFHVIFLIFKIWTLILKIVKTFFFLMNLGMLK